MIWFRLICEHFLFHLLPLLLSWSHVMTLFYLLIAGFIFQVFWGHLIDESNGFRWLMGWPKSSFGFPITSQGINWINFLMFLSIAPPKYLSTTKNIFLLLSRHRSPGAASNSKSCCFYLQNMCQIHQTGNKIFFSYHFTTKILFSATYTVARSATVASYWPSCTLPLQKDHPWSHKSFSHCFFLS